MRSPLLPRQRVGCSSMVSLGMLVWAWTNSDCCSVVPSCPPPRVTTRTIPNRLLLPSDLRAANSLPEHTDPGSSSPSHWEQGIRLSHRCQKPYYGIGDHNIGTIEVPTPWPSGSLRERALKRQLPWRLQGSAAYSASGRLQQTPQS